MNQILHKDVRKPVPRARVLWLLVISQFACISIWFAGNSVIGDLVREFSITQQDVGHLTSIVQLGFIAGTLLFAIAAFADRYRPSAVFFVSAVMAAFCNCILLFSDGNLWMLYGSRFLTGFFLAGIYPVGMKIASDYFSKDLGKALGFLVGALVLGTAFPHLLKYFQTGLPWKTVMISTSILALVGGGIVYLFIPEGPFRAKGPGFKDHKVWNAFRSKSFQAASFGYFGHMWELYAFWAFVPILLAKILDDPPALGNQTSLFSFLVIGIGSLGCVFGGYAAKFYGSYRVAFTALLLSGFCCLISPLIFQTTLPVMLLFLLCWGIVVVMDSPQFSAMVAETVSAENKGAALTMVTCIGFSITILSIQFMTWMIPIIPLEYLFMLLLPGPIIGVIALTNFSKEH